MTALSVKPRPDTGIIADSQEAADLRFALRKAGEELSDIAAIMRYRAYELNPTVVPAHSITDARKAIARATAALDAFERAGTGKAVAS